MPAVAPFRRERGAPIVVIAGSSPLFLAALRGLAKPVVILPRMNSTKSREVIWGGRVSAAKDR